MICKEAYQLQDVQQPCTCGMPAMDRVSPFTPSKEVMLDTGQGSAWSEEHDRLHPGEQQQQML